jgi:hypothetical protein
MEILLDLTHPTDVQLLDTVVAAFLNPQNPSVSRPQGPRPVAPAIDHRTNRPS